MNRRLDLDYRKKPIFRRIRRRTLLLILLGVLLLGGGTWALFQTSFVQSLLAPISFIVNLSKPVSLQEVDGRVNVLVLGVDTRGSGWSGLTDTILVGSISPLEGKPALISIPRDFWVNLSPYGQGKINTAYNYSGTQKDGKFDAQKGVEFSKSKIETVLGVQIPYWVVVNFEGFKEIIDTLEGIEVCVEKSFDDYKYPVPGKENDPVILRRYERLHFNAGCQTMNGEVALKYARSRSGTNGEASDFARVRRQQNVIRGVKEKILSLNLLLNPGKLSQLYRQFNSAIKTNASFGEIRRSLEIAAKLGDLSQIESLVLDPDSGLVFHPKPSLFGGAYVVVPKGGDTNYTKIHQAVRNLLFGEPAESAPPQGEKP
ncbi:MAG: LCP family protein [candidate division WWE3 bacterium]|nr:LCP family protein [candidate division WWE3 bacterium]